MLPLYHELLRQRPNRFHYVQQYATLLFSLGEEEEGLRAMNLAISIRPEEPAPYVSLGHHARMKGDYGTARRHHKGVNSGHYQLTTERLQACMRVIFRGRRI